MVVVTSDAANFCQWCGCVFRPKRGGSPQRFCGSCLESGMRGTSFENGLLLSRQAESQVFERQRSHRQLVWFVRFSRPLLFLNRGCGILAQTLQLQPRPRRQSPPTDSPCPDRSPPSVVSIRRRLLPPLRMPDSAELGRSATTNLFVH
jgi:hypothetical protein